MKEVAWRCVMDLKKIVPWNWFKKEEETGTAVPVHHTRSLKPYKTNGHVDLIQGEVDRLFDNFFKGWF
jgi:HSP20 family protein